MHKKGEYISHDNLDKSCPNHHRANARGYVMEHILVFEEKTGVKVPTNCCVHHLNGNKRDNRIENLCLMSHAAHTAFHKNAKKENKP